MKPSLKYGALGLIAGALNGLFGAGGGLLVVPMLRRQKLPDGERLPEKNAHATSIAVTLPLSLASGAAYLCRGVPADWGTLGLAVPFGLIGAAAGAFLLARMKSSLLRRLFGAVMIFSAIRLLLR